MTTPRKKRTNYQNSGRSPWQSHDPKIAAMATAKQQREKAQAATPSEAAADSDNHAQEPKSGIRKRPFIAPVDDSLTDRALAVMARESNPSPQDWMSDPSKLPKIPPHRLKRPDST